MQNIYLFLPAPKDDQRAWRMPLMLKVCPELQVWSNSNCACSSDDRRQFLTFSHTPCTCDEYDTKIFRISDNKYQNKKNIPHKQLRSIAWVLIHFGAFSWRELNAFKLVYDPNQLESQLSLTPSAFNQLGQYTISPGRKAYCYAELAVFIPRGGHHHCQYSVHLRLSWPGWLVTERDGLPTWRLSHN